MSTTSNSSPDDTDSARGPERVRWRSSAQLEYAIGHVFLPAHRGYTIPDHPVGNDSLVHAVYATAVAYSETVDDSLKPQWRRITRMLSNLQAYLQPEGRAKHQIISQLSGMQTGDILVFFNEGEDAGIIFTKQEKCTLYESFQTSRDSRSKFDGPCSECAVEIPDEVLHNQYFLFELANFLHHLDGFPTFSEGVAEGSAGLLTSIVRVVGRITEVPHTLKRVQSHYKLQFWNRSLPWLLIKIAIQTFLCGVSGSTCYKPFMLRFMCDLARDAIGSDLSSDLLHAISAKVLRRFSKLSQSTRDGLHDTVAKTSGSLRKILQARWKEVEAARRQSPLWRPSQLDLDADTQLSLTRCKQYIDNSLASLHSKHLYSPFCPETLPRYVLDDFLSSNGSKFEEAYHANPHVTLYDVEQAVGDGIDDWIPCVTDVDQACVQLAGLMDKYLSSARDTYTDPELLSIMYLTALELWIALDKLAVGTFPMLAEVSPGVVTSDWQLFRSKTNIHRLRRAHQYLLARYSQYLLRRPVFSDDTTRRRSFDCNIAESEQGVASPGFRRLIEAYGTPSSADVPAPESRCPPFLLAWRSCTTRLHSFERMGGLSAYQHPSEFTLGRYINSTYYSSNRVLADQAGCPDDLSLHEFIAFGHLRSGGSLQWLNILQGLRSGTLNFRRHDVYLLFSQAASQIGPFDWNTAEWEWHQELRETSFCHALLDELKCLLEGAHSLDAVTMGIISLLLTRLLVSSPCEEVEERAIELLRRVRRETFDWVLELSYSLTVAPMDTEQGKLLRDMAAACWSTFDVDPDMVHKVLCYAEDVDALLFCAILTRVGNVPIDPESVRENLRGLDRKRMSEYLCELDPTSIQTLCSSNDFGLLGIPEYLRSGGPEEISEYLREQYPESISAYLRRLLLERNRRLLLTLESVLRDAILADGLNRGIDLAVHNIWSGYVPGPCGWQALPCPDSYWLTCEAMANGSGHSQSVHLNLLDGTLLVDGKPIDGLPQKIRKQPTYKRIFDDQSFLCISSGLPGMEYSSLGSISEHQVHFAMQGNNLVIRAKHKDAEDILEVIPQEELEGDIPTPLVHGHVHWLNLTTSVIEIRPLKRAWEQSSENWRVDRASRKYRMYKGHELLVDIQSPTCGMVSSRLRCLDVPENLIATTSANTPQSSPSGRLSVALPRLGLLFFVNQDGELESCDFDNMVYDENQRIGTLFGLENRLVLRPKDKARQGLFPRCVIIPEGKFSRKHHKHHLRVSIDSDAAQLVTCHTYQVDVELGCLTGYTSWEDKLYLARLHAGTSVDWMPDPLTGRTGIEEALTLLQSAGCRSIMKREIRGNEPELPFFDDDEMYPQIKFVVQEIKHLIARQRFLFNNGSYPSRPKLDVVDAWRTAYLFPLEPVALPVHAPLEVKAKPRKSSERDELARTVSLAVYHWLIKMVDMAESRGDIELMATSVAESVWPNPEFVPPSIAKVNAFLQADKQLPLQSNSEFLAPSITDVEAFLQEATEARQRIRLLFLLPTIVYSREDPQPHFLSILVAITRHQSNNSQRYAQCQPSIGYRPSKDAVLECLDGVPAHSWEESRGHATDKLFDTWAATKTVALLVTRRDPHYRVKQLNPFVSPIILNYIDVDDVKRLNAKLQALFSVYHPNLKLKGQLTRRLAKLEKNRRYALLDPAKLPPALKQWPRLSKQPSGSPFKPLPPKPWQVTLGQLLPACPPPKLPDLVPMQRCIPEGHRLASNSDTHALNQLLDSPQFNRTNPLYPFQERYVANLRTSAQHIHEAPHMTFAMTRRPIKELREHYRQCRLKYTQSLAKLEKVLSPKNDPLEQLLHQSGQWPRITPDTLFRCLASTSSVKLSDDWEQCLLSLVLLLLELQRTRRLLRFDLDGLREEFWRALEDKGCVRWSAERYYPDWLLIQLQGDFLIREIQADVATNMISPSSGINTAMQVIMGEGKSSVILPISAAALTDDKQLVRVIVPKALTVQMFQLLVDRLGGLVNRPIYHLPFSRSLTGMYSDHHFEILRELLSECIRDRGILVVQPEHVLSLKLTSVAGQVTGHRRGASLRLQRLLDSCCRDLLDESDEVLHPRFQLIYTTGTQQRMKGYPDRWTITQQVLRLLKRHAVSGAFSNAIECERSPSGSFPHIRILRDADNQASQGLMSSIVERVMDGQLPGLRLWNMDRHEGLPGAVRAFISSKAVLPQTTRMVEEYARQTGLWDRILLLRGLFACDILLFALAERRWRVDYGLSPNRTMLAVPYRAKDVPAPAAEFSHPDIMIVLTCLSYYYGGLTEEQLRDSFRLLEEQDDPSKEYADWLQDHDAVPESFRDLKNVNIKSSEQWRKYLFPLFSRSQGAVDFYLSRIVFPKEANEYPLKIAASSWDLVEKRDRVITGFSGTNDGQYLFPKSITQRDLDHQLGTNARVLSYLLQPENNFYMAMAHANGVRQTTPELIKMVVDQEPKIRVFLDVGAQILDLSNYEVAKTWLDLSRDSDGAIYFSDDDELMVLTKDGTSWSLLSSPLARRLDRCVVYFDDAHTRGTDLKLPSGFRAAVTLGPKVTKDRLAQGCMRMRKLGNGHSVMFFAPPDVDRIIRVIVAKDYPEDITTTDILRWAIHETWSDIQQRAPYWVQQAVSHHSRYHAWARFSGTPQLLRFSMRKMLADAWVRPELKPLAELYAPPSKDTPRHSIILHNHPDIQQHCKDLGVLKLPEAEMDEEREREVNREIEREREVQGRPPYATSAKHSLHPGVVAFVKTGVIPPLHTYTAFHPIFATLRGSSARTHIWSPFVLATSDFRRTIERGPDIDHFLRPVQWVLSGRMYHNRVLVLLSPYEARWLMPDIRASKHVHLHLYIPRVSEYMKPADDLRFYSIPPVPENWEPPWDLLDQLNLFAGQLYLRDYESYSRLCRFLGMQSDSLAKKVSTAVRRNLTTPGVLDGIENTFTDSQRSSVMKLLIVRQKGLPFSETHMGRILQGEQLSKEDFEGTPWAKSGNNPHDARIQHGVTSAAIGEDGPALLATSRVSNGGQETVNAAKNDNQSSCERVCSEHSPPISAFLQMRLQTNSFDSISSFD